MLKLLIRILCLVILGVLAYDISQTGSFYKSNTYKYLKDAGVVDNGEVVLKEAKKAFSKASSWAEKNVPVYYNETCTQLKPYIDLTYDITLVFRNSAVAFMHNAVLFLDKNFPAFQNSMLVILTDAMTLAKNSMVVISGHLQNCTLMAVQYANNMLGS